jgi:hypothetical protein
MKRVIDTSEVLGTVEQAEGSCEVCASADAAYDEAARRVVIRLDAFLRTANPRSKERRLRAPWLPAGETVSESAAPEEAGAVAREIFQRWVRKVRHAAPPLHNPTL